MGGRGGCCDRPLPRTLDAGRRQTDAELPELTGLSQRLEPLDETRELICARLVLRAGRREALKRRRRQGCALRRLFPFARTGSPRMSSSRRCLQNMRRSLRCASFRLSISGWARETWDRGPREGPGRRRTWRNCSASSHSPSRTSPRRNEASCALAREKRPSCLRPPLRATRVVPRAAPPRTPPSPVRALAAPCSIRASGASEESLERAHPCARRVPRAPSLRSLSTQKHDCPARCATSRACRQASKEIAQCT